MQVLANGVSEREAVEGVIGEGGQLGGPIGQRFFFIIT